MYVLIGPMQRPWPACCQSGSLMRGDGEGVGNYRLIGQLPGTDYLGPIGLSRPAGTLGPAQGMLPPGGTYNVLQHFKLHWTTMHFLHYWLQRTVVHINAFSKMYCYTLHSTAHLYNSALYCSLCCTALHQCMTLHSRTQDLYEILLNWPIHLYHYISSCAGLVLHSVTQFSRHRWQQNSIEGNMHLCNITTSAVISNIKENN